MMLHENGTSERVVIGPDLQTGHCVQLLIPGKYVPHCTRHRTKTLVPRREHRMARRRESRGRNQRRRSASGEISRRG
ncbi:MAG: hypothetical protein ACJ8KF_04760 [Chthoniobacterales bacterium]